MDADVIIIGSGFGGSVSALRLTEKGYSVLVLEAGRRFSADDFPKTTWNMRRFLWFPRLGMRGIQRMDLLREVLALSGAGVGGGSLVYANTLIEPYDDFYTDRQWADITDWKTELAPWYDQARRSLGVEEANGATHSDQIIRRIARRMGAEETFHPVDVAVYRGDSGVTVDDPYFGGVGPTRTGCIECGGCMVGCRHEAKNTLDRNYLYLAEQGGARILPEHQVVDVAEAGDGSWVVTTQRSGAWIRTRRRTFRARHVIFSAGGLGTTKLMLRLRDRGRLGNASDRIGSLVRTNSEAVVGAVAKGTETDYSHGVAITSSFRAGPRTRIEPVRYPAGSNSMGLLSTILVPGGRWQPVRFLWWVLKSPIRWFKSLSVRRWSERGLILLVMQSEDNSIRLEMKRGLFRRKVTSRPGHGTPNPRWIPLAHDAARIAADEMDGQPMASINESMLGIPVTAHLIGGATIGSSPERGVVDPYHRVFGNHGLHVVDGSAVPANLGSNPSLTITAMAERAMSMWPNNGDEDPRPAVGERYRPVAAVAPRDPMVPDGAPAALR